MFLSSSKLLGRGFGRGFLKKRQMVFDLQRRPRILPSTSASRKLLGWINSVNKIVISLPWPSIHANVPGKARMTRSLKTSDLERLVQRHQQKDAVAFEELLSLCFHRIERLTHKMLANYPLVAQQEQTGDVLDNALLRLRRALQSVGPVSTREFFCPLPSRFDGNFSIVCVIIKGDSNLRR